MNTLHVEKGNTTFQQNNYFPSLKHGGGSMMFWACFDASGPELYATIDRKTNSRITKEYF